MAVKRSIRRVARQCLLRGEAYDHGARLDSPASLAAIFGDRVVQAAKRRIWPASTPGEGSSPGKAVRVLQFNAGSLMRPGRLRMIVDDLARDSVDVAAIQGTRLPQSKDGMPRAEWVTRASDGKESYHFAWWNTNHTLHHSGTIDS